ncbi:MAG: hypothetical protein COA79_15175 [Planctomycetota bacterium]|nr:MAG: hypothetical protein COA79_15175 [Planctomycetota bacterium]
MKSVQLIPFFLILFSFVFSQENKSTSEEPPVNTWVRIADSPGDALGREVPPGRGSSWVYSKSDQVFYRYGGFTPRYSNAIFSFNPKTKEWKEVMADDENYPLDRAHGVAGANLGWDEKNKLLWIGLGRRSVNTGKYGIWSYSPSDKKFKYMADSPHQSIQNVCFALDLNLAVFSPPLLSNGYPKNHTYVLDLTTGKSKKVKSIVPIPNWIYSGSYPSIYQKN